MGGYDIGPKIGISGEAEYRSQLNAIITTQRTLKTEMGAVASAFDKGERSMEQLRATGGVLEKQVAAQREKLEMVKRALQEATEKYGEADSRTQKWQQVVNKATEELNNMERELRQNREALEDMEAGLEDADRALDEFGDSADRAGRQGSAFGGIVKANITSEAIISGVRALADASIELATGLAKCAIEGAAYADTILTTSSVTGLSTEALQAYSYAAELVDVSLDTLTSSMARQIRAMQSASEGSASYVAAYEALKVEVVDTSGNLRDSETVFWEVIDALGQMTNETERDAIAMDLMGRSAQDLNPLIEAGAERMAQLAQEAQAAGYILGNEALENFGALDDTLQRLSLSGEAAKNALGVSLAPTLEYLASSGTDILTAFTSGLNETGDLTTATEVGLAIVESILMGVLSSAETAIPALMDGFLFPLVDMVLTNLPMLVETGFELAMALADGIIGYLPEMLPLLVEAVVQISIYLLEYGIPALISSGGELIAALLEGLIAGIGVLLQQLPQLLTSLVECFSSGSDEFISIGGDIVAGIWSGISSGFGWITTQISGWVGDVLEFFKSLLGIHSPSTVFADEIGIQMAKGVGVGFTGGLEGVSKDMERAQQELNGKMSSMAMALETSQTLNVGTQTVVYHHTGTVRIEGVSDEGEFIGAASVVYDDLVAELKKEART